MWALLNCGESRLIYSIHFSRYSKFPRFPLLVEVRMNKRVVRSEYNRVELWKHLFETDTQICGQETMTSIRKSVAHRMFTCNVSVLYRALRPKNTSSYE